ncbi:hypothetical protein J437_LFUL014680 [Ladona fulva]|uniref:Endonuclease/exonuclease/phosphatase domain-containing protein n=1 Tax=Ladona fulva TaxID=123851 RepID=A0A8K0PC00_LADFU|nr:hypothetical protein J437_LFUL014680 [Ladona fulva]
MLKPGRMKEVAHEMQKYGIDVIGLQEIRWQAQGRVDKKVYTLLYSGPEYRTGRFGTGFIISIHAPMEDKTELEKKEFHEELENLFNLCQDYDMVTIQRDFNAKIGRKDEMKRVAGRHWIPEKSSENGTWRIPGTNAVNQIDHVLTERRHSSTATDVRAYRGPNCDSDHYLVRAVIVQRLSKTKETSKSGKIGTSKN